jgi:hypothetical protein
MMPAAVFTPTAATRPAICIAWAIGSPAPLRRAWGRGEGRCRVCGRDAAAGRFARGDDADARGDDADEDDDALDLVARFFAGVRFGAAAPPVRLALLRPGRERGRLPRTPGSSSRSEATTGENSGPRGVVARTPVKRPPQRRKLG